MPKKLRDVILATYFVGRKEVLPADSPVRFCSYYRAARTGLTNAMAVPFGRNLSAIEKTLFAMNGFW